MRPGERDGFTELFVADDGSVMPGRQQCPANWLCFIGAAMDDALAIAGEVQDPLGRLIAVGVAVWLLFPVLWQGHDDLRHHASQRAIPALCVPLRQCRAEMVGVALLLSMCRVS